MARRCERAPPISLFFFQDIITCVAGVMILLMMLFALLAPDEPVTTTDVSVAEALSLDRFQEIQKLRERLTSLRRVESAYAYARDLTRLESTTAPLEKEAAEREEEIKSILLEIAGIQDSIQQAKERRARSQRKLDELRKVRKIRFIPQKRSGKTPILVECSEDVILCGLAGRGLEPVEFTIEPLEPFLEHVKRFDPASHFFVFLTKPSAPSSIIGVVRLVQLRGFQAGYDALEEDGRVDFEGSG